MATVAVEAVATVVIEAVATVAIEAVATAAFEVLVVSVSEVPDELAVAKEGGLFHFQVFVPHRDFRQQAGLQDILLFQVANQVLLPGAEDDLQVDFLF